MKRIPYVLLGLVAGVLWLMSCSMLQVLDGELRKDAVRPSDSVTGTRVEAAQGQRQLAIGAGYTTRARSRRALTVAGPGGPIRIRL